jgi:hypothetical protein
MYVPTATLLMKYSQLGLVLAPVVVPLIRTFTPGSGSPVSLSLITPAIFPVVCASTETEKTKTRRKVSPAALKIGLFNKLIPPHCLKDLFSG